MIFSIDDVYISHQSCGASFTSSMFRDPTLNIIGHSFVETTNLVLQNINDVRHIFTIDSVALPARPDDSRSFGRVTS